MKVRMLVLVAVAMLLAVSIGEAADNKTTKPTPVAERRTQEWLYRALEALCNTDKGMEFDPRTGECEIAPPEAIRWGIWQHYSQKGDGS